MSSELTWSRYGKDKVRIFRTVRDGKIHHVVEYNVCALLEGDIDTSYTEADNSVVVATDSSTQRLQHLYRSLLMVLRIFI